MPGKSLHLVLIALALLWTNLALAQRSSTMEERLEFRRDPAGGDELSATKATTPEQCRDLCLANGGCHFWTWAERGSSCVLLKSSTGASRGRGLGYRYVSGMVNEAPARREAAAKGCAHEVKTWSDGARMEGMMCNGKLHGRGSYRDPSGQRYEGEWRNGVIAGQGVAHFPNGAVYDGQWENGKPHGPGTYTNPGVGTFTGTWRNGCAIISGQNLWVATERAACGF